MMTYDEIEEQVRRAAPNAYLLRQVTAHLGKDDRAVWLDPDKAVVWLAALGVDDWSVTAEAGESAAHWIHGALETVWQAISAGEATADDLAAAAEYADVELASMRLRVRGAGIKPPQRPALVDGMIRRRIEDARREVGRLAALRAAALRDAYGWGHGAIAEAARGLGISHAAAGKVLAAADTYAARATATRRAEREAEVEE